MTNYDMALEGNQRREADEFARTYPMPTFVDDQQILDRRQMARDRALLTEANPDHHPQPISCTECGQVSWRRAISGTWASMEHFETNVSTRPYEDPIEENEGVQREPWECNECGMYGGPNIERALNERAEAPYR